MKYKPSIIQTEILSSSPNRIPQPGMCFLYRKNDGKWYEKLSNGTEQPITSDGSGGGEFPPVISSVNPSSLTPNTTRIISLAGELFNPVTTISVGGVAINPAKITYVSSMEIFFEFTAPGDPGFLDLVVNNGSGETTVLSGIEIQESNWLFLGTGGYSFTHGNASDRDIRYRDTMTLIQDAQGIYFEGENPWASWVKFEFLRWNRGEGKTLKMVLQNTRRVMMAGLGSTEIDESSNSMFYQGELQFYHNHRNLIGLYGNTGQLWNGTQTSINTSLQGQIHRLEIENDGAINSVVRFYNLPSANASDWDDLSTLIYEGQVGSNHTPDSPVLLPLVVPRDGEETKIIAVQVS